MCLLHYRKTTKKSTQQCHATSNHCTAVQPRRKMEEGYDLPDPRYRLWLASVTAESGSIAASTTHPAATDISSPSPADLESVCQAGRCEHLKARKWIQCDYCPLWYHCLCPGIAYRSAKDKKYKCLSCIQA